MAALKIADLELVKVRLKLLEVCAAGDLAQTRLKAEALEEWVFRAPKPGLIERITSTLGISGKTK